MAFCSNCGNKLEDGAKFCPKCGKQVDIKEESKGFIDSVKQGWKEGWEEDSKSQKHIKGRKTKKMGCWTYGFIALLLLGFVGFLEDKCEGEGSKTTEQVSKEKQEVKGTSKQDYDIEAQSQAREQKEKEKEKRNIINAFVGDYTYSYYLDNTNAKLYFKLSLKADGTFIFKPANESTKGMMDVDKVMSGYEYPEGGKWEVKDTSVGKAAFLEFDCNWGEGSITPDKSVIQIKNMNGYNLKAPLVINN